MRELSTAAVLDETAGVVGGRMQPMQAPRLWRADARRAKRLGPPRIALRETERCEVTARFAIRSEHSQPTLLLEARGDTPSLERVEAAVRGQALEVLGVQALPCAGFRLYLVEIARAPFCTSRRQAIAAGVSGYFQRVGAAACAGDQPERTSSSSAR